MILLINQKIDKNKANEIRNQILFETPTATENSAIRNVSEIEKSYTRT